MSEALSPKGNSRGEPIYEIRIQGHLQDKWTDRLGGMVILREEDGTTRLKGPLPDQTALHSVLQRIRDMNLILISIRQIG